MFIFLFIIKNTMENLRNKTQNLKDNKISKDYFNRFYKLNIYSYTKDNKIYLGAKPEEVYSLFSGNTSSIKKDIKDTMLPQELTIDQSTLQYYMILALQDFYYNYHLPLYEELKRTKKKNDERFETIRVNLETMTKHINNIKK